MVSVFVSILVDLIKGQSKKYLFQVFTLLSKIFAPCIQNFETFLRFWSIFYFGCVCIIFYTWNRADCFGTKFYYGCMEVLLVEEDLKSQVSSILEEAHSGYYDPLNKKWKSLWGKRQLFGLQICSRSTKRKKWRMKPPLSS